MEEGLVTRARAWSMPSSSSSLCTLPLETLNAELYVVQRKLLNAPRKERHRLKQETLSLDAKIREATAVHRAKTLQLRLGESDAITDAGTCSDCDTECAGEPTFPPSPSGATSPVHRLCLSQCGPYVSSSDDEGIGEDSQDDQEHERTWTYHRQLMGQLTQPATTMTHLSEVEDNDGGITTVTDTNMTAWSVKDLATQLAAQASRGEELREGSNEVRAAPRDGEASHEQEHEHEGCLPAELAFLQNFSFLEEMARREEIALREELGLGEDEDVREELGLELGLEDDQDPP